MDLERIASIVDEYIQESPIEYPEKPLNIKRIIPPTTESGGSPQWNNKSMKPRFPLDTEWVNQKDKDYYQENQPQHAAQIPFNMNCDDLPPKLTFQINPEQESKDLSSQLGSMPDSTTCLQGEIGIE